MQEINFVELGNFFLQKSEKCCNVIFGPMLCWDSLTSGLLGPLLLRFWGWFIPKTFQGLHFFVFWVTQFKDSYVNNLPVTQIWGESAECGCADLISWYVDPKPKRSKEPPSFGFIIIGCSLLDSKAFDEEHICISGLTQWNLNSFEFRFDDTYQTFLII